MAVLKNKTKRDNFLIVSKIFLQDTNLSLTERGLLATMHSLPDDWNFSIAGMSKILPDGDSKIKAALDGLIRKGYVTRVQSKLPTGKFSKNIIEVNERPKMIAPSGDFPIADNSVAVDAVSEKALAGECGQYNIKEYSKKLFKNNQSINQSYETDGKTENDSNYSYKKLIAKNIKLDWLYEVARSHSEDEVAMVEEIYDLMCDMVCFKRENVVIHKTSYPWEAVKSRFLKLRYEHIADILNRVIDESLGIKNMQAYLISMLYSASLVGTIELQAKLHDDYLKYLIGTPYMNSRNLE